MKISTFTNIFDKKLIVINKVVSKAIKKAVKKLNKLPEFSDNDGISILSFGEVGKSNRTGSDVETICVGLIASQSEEALHSYYSRLPKDMRVIDIKDIPDIDSKAKTVKRGKDIADQPIDDESENLPCDANHNPFTAVYEDNQSLAPKKSVDNTESFSDYITRTEKKEKVMFGTLGEGVEYVKGAVANIKI